MENSVVALTTIFALICWVITGISIWKMITFNPLKDDLVELIFAAFASVFVGFLFIIPLLRLLEETVR